MKKIIFFLLIIFLLSLILCSDTNKSQKPKKKKQKQKQKDKKNKDFKVNKQEENIKEKEENENVKEEEEEKEEEVKEEENYNEKYRGIYMTEKAYYRKVNRIFEEKGLKGKKKITKEKLKSIFDEIYKEEKDNDDPDSEEDGNNSNIMDLFFNEIFKSYDHDDYINLKGIKKLMSPKNVQDAMFTVYVDMAGSLGYL